MSALLAALARRRAEPPPLLEPTSARAADVSRSADTWRAHAASDEYVCRWRSPTDADEFDADVALLHEPSAFAYDTLVLALSLGWRMHAFMAELETIDVHDRFAHLRATLGDERAVRARALARAPGTLVAHAIFGFANMRDVYTCMALAMLAFERPLERDRVLTDAGWALVRGTLELTYAELMPLVVAEQLRLEAAFLANAAARDDDAAPSNAATTDNSRGGGGDGDDDTSSSSRKE